MIAVGPPPNDKKGDNYFEHDHFGNKIRIRFEGICIHQGKTPLPEQTKILTELFTKQLLAKGIGGYEVAADTVEKKTNPGLSSTACSRCFTASSNWPIR